MKIIQRKILLIASIAGAFLLLSCGSTKTHEMDTKSKPSVNQEQVRINLNNKPTPPPKQEIDEEDNQSFLTEEDKKEFSIYEEEENNEDQRPLEEITLQKPKSTGYSLIVSGFTNFEGENKGLLYPSGQAIASLKLIPFVDGNPKKANELNETNQKLYQADIEALTKLIESLQDGLPASLCIDKNKDKNSRLFTINTKIKKFEGKKDSNGNYILTTFDVTGKMDEAINKALENPKNNTIVEGIKNYINNKPYIDIFWDFKFQVGTKFGSGRPLNGKNYNNLS